MMVADYLDLPFIFIGAFVLKGGMVGDASGRVEAKVVLRFCVGIELMFFMELCTVIRCRAAILFAGIVFKV